MKSAKIPEYVVKFDSLVDAYRVNAHGDFNCFPFCKEYTSIQ